MGITKQYLRFVPGSIFNIIASPGCNVVSVELNGCIGRYVAVGACENIIIWDLRLGQKTMVLEGDRWMVTVLAASPNMKQLAAGYADGTVRIFDLSSGELVCTFAGHKSAVSCLAYDANSVRLASGGKDTDVVVWDVVSESGLFRLSGHKGSITKVGFLLNHNVLVSSSKDMLVKFWDLDVQYCFKTLVGHRSEVWGFALVQYDHYLVTGSSDNELRVWELLTGEDTAKSNERDMSGKTGELKVVGDDSQAVEMEEDVEEVDEFDKGLKLPLRCRKAGSVLRGGRGRIASIVTDPSSCVFACHGTDFAVESFHFCSEEEAQRRNQKRMKRARKKAGKTGGDVGSIDTGQHKSAPSLQDRIRRLPLVKTKAKIKSVAVLSGPQGEVKFHVLTSVNGMETFTVNTSSKGLEPQHLGSLLHPGHRSDPRAVCFSSDGRAIVTVSAEGLKIWARPSLQCLRTVKITGYVLSVTFVPGDRHIVAGTKAGVLVIVDVMAGTVIEEIQAHCPNEVWSVCLTHDQRGFVSGGGDSTVKFWDFELVSTAEKKREDDEDDSAETIHQGQGRVLTALHTRTLKVDETVLSVCISPNGNLLALSLLDSTVKIFYVDTLKFFLSLYGHKLPALSLDISYDSNLLVTGSADRCIKIWGLDFGDCRRSLFAHDDSVTCVRFVPKTHQVFSCGKDGKVKQWDVDNFERITTLQGHRGEAWSLAVSGDGKRVVSVGADRCARLWERSEEPLVLEDERQSEREKEEAQALATGEESSAPGIPALKLPSRKTVGAENATEQLIEALDVYETYTAELKAHKKICKMEDSKSGLTLPQVPPLMAAYRKTCPNEFLMDVLQRIRSSELEEALLLLPFSHAVVLLQATPSLLRMPGRFSELAARCLTFLLRIHLGQLAQSDSLGPKALKRIMRAANQSISSLKDMVGFNVHAMQLLHWEIEAKNDVQLFAEAFSTAKEKKRKKRKREKALQRALMVL